MYRGCLKTEKLKKTNLVKMLRSLLYDDRQVNALKAVQFKKKNYQKGKNREEVENNS